MKYRIWSIEHDGWWKENKHGYVSDIKSAGIFTLYEANAICCDANVMMDFNNDNTPNEAMVPVEEE